MIFIHIGLNCSHTTWANQKKAGMLWYNFHTTALISLIYSIIATLEFKILSIQQPGSFFHDIS